MHERVLSNSPPNSYDLISLDYLPFQHAILVLALKTAKAKGLGGADILDFPTALMQRGTYMLQKYFPGDPNLGKVLNLNRMIVDGAKVFH